MRLTIEIPDRLAEQLEPERENLAQIIARGLRRSWSGTSGLRREVVSFLANHPTADQMLQFRPSPEASSRLEYLLKRNRENALTQEEEAELDDMCEVDRFISLIKTQTLLRKAGHNGG